MPLLVESVMLTICFLHFYMQRLRQADDLVAVSRGRPVPVGDCDRGASGRGQQEASRDRGPPTTRYINRDRDHNTDKTDTFIDVICENNIKL